MAKWESREKLKELEKLRGEDGLAFDEIAKYMGIGARTLHAWRGKSDKIFKALDNGTKALEILLEDAIFKSATGHREVVKITRTYTTQGGDKQTTEETIEEKYFPPDKTALIFYLSNINNERWRRVDRKDIDGDIADKIEIILKRDYTPVCDKKEGNIDAKNSAE